MIPLVCVLACFAPLLGRPLCAALGLQGASPADQAALESAIDQVVLRVLDEQAIPGAVIGVVVGDELVYRKAFGVRDRAADVAMTPDTLFQIGSVTKSMTAVLMGVLRDESLLSFDDTIGEHLPANVELSRSLRALTLRQLATHTAGLPRDAVNRRNVPDTPTVALPYSVRDLYEGLAQTELVAEPGGKSIYSNLGFALLGHVLELAAGESYEELLRSRLLEPLGMSASGIQPSAEQEKRLALHYWNRDEPRVARERWKFGEVVGHGGAFSCVDDLARYLAMQYSTDEGLPVSRETLAELHAPFVLFEDSDDQFLGTGWFVYRFPGGTIISHDGEVDGNSASIAFLEGRDLGVIALANLGRDSAGSLSKAVLRAAVTSRR